MTADGTAFEAHPEQMLAVAGNIAVTVSQVQDVVRELQGLAVPAAGLGLLGNPVTAASERVQKVTDRALSLTVSVLDDLRSAVQVGVQSYTTADNQVAAGNRSVIANGGAKA